MVMAVLVAFWSLRQDANLASIGILVYLAVLLGETLLAHGRLRFEKVCLCLVAGLLLHLSADCIGPHSGHVCRRGPWAK